MEAMLFWVGSALAAGVCIELVRRLARRLPCDRACRACRAQCRHHCLCVRQPTDQD